mgnify:CR=1 FL=1|tara:strand:- start:508 stop:954 length:447 start_codon:yes stop_codon:yes gene_type:complete
MTTQFFNTKNKKKLGCILKKTPFGEFFCFCIYLFTMKSENLKTQILDLFEEIKHEKKTELQLEGLSSAYAKLAKFLLKQVRGGKLSRNYDIDDNSGRMVFQTGSGKKIVFNDMKLGVTANKTWKGKKDNEFFSYNDHDKILKFALADI